MTSVTPREVEGRTRDERERVARHPSVGASARVGLAARGVLYVLVGVLTVRLASGNASTPADKSGALATVARQPLGKALLVALALGFAAYAVWMVVRVFVIEEDRATTEWAKRAVFVGRAALYAVLCFSAVDALRRSANATQRQGSQQEHEWTTRVLGWPGGRLLVAAIGVAVVIGGIVFVYRGVTRQWLRTLDLGSTSRRVRATVVGIGWAGWIGRGVVFALVGVFLVRAAWRFDPNDAVGLDNSLRELAHGAIGRPLLYVAALGLLAFGLYSFVEARYRQVDRAEGPD
jgi:hypothetical protein